MLSDEWLSRYGLLENFNASVTLTGKRTGTGTGTWTTGVTAIALCTSCSRAKNVYSVYVCLKCLCQVRNNTRVILKDTVVSVLSKVKNSRP